MVIALLCLVSSLFETYMKQIQHRITKHVSRLMPTKDKIGEFPRPGNSHLLWAEIPDCVPDPFGKVPCRPFFWSKKRNNQKRDQCHQSGKYPRTRSNQEKDKSDKSGNV